MINYTWLITNLELQKQAHSLQNVVITINWTLTASDGDYRSREFGTTKLPAPDPSSFIDFQNLTNDTLVSWIIANENVDALKQKLAEYIAEMQNKPTVFVNFPRASQTPAQVPFEEQKLYAKQRLQASYNSELMLGVTSTALGTLHTYRCLPAEQFCLQMAAQFGGLVYCEANGLWAYQQHTADEATVVLGSMWQRIQTLQQKLQTLSNSVDAATSEDEVNAIFW